jgi:hypothetical protein
MTEKRPVIRGTNRPDLIPRPLGTLFHDTGATGWGRKRDLRDHKRGKSEANFADQHDKFAHLDDLDEE